MLGNSNCRIGFGQVYDYWVRGPLGKLGKDNAIWEPQFFVCSRACNPEGPRTPLVDNLGPNWVPI